MSIFIIAKKLSCKILNKLIIDDINFDINRGEFISIVGPSGSGKSTLAKALLGLTPIDGYLNICNMHVCKNNIEEIRKNIGIVFENPDNYFVIEITSSPGFTSLPARLRTSAYSSVLQMMTGVIMSYPAALTLSRSISRSRSPLCTVSPEWT